MDFKYLNDRLDQMVWLLPDWDGFGSVPITSKVYDVGKHLLSLIEGNNNITSFKIFVGVDEPGTLVIYAKMCNHSVDMIIKTDGSIDYEEFQTGKSIGNGSFYLSKSVLETIFS